jgi:hypothetical protein
VLARLGADHVLADRPNLPPGVERISNDADRKRFADTLDTTFLKAGRDATFKVSGAKNTTLEMVYVLVNQPMVYQITNDTNSLRMLGMRASRRSFSEVDTRTAAARGPMMCLLSCQTKMHGDVLPLVCRRRKISEIKFGKSVFIIPAD